VQESVQDDKKHTYKIRMFDCLISNNCQRTDGRCAEYPSEWEVE